MAGKVNVIKNELRSQTQLPHPVSSTGGSAIIFQMV
uniref:Uncharacterized protein n=1 Tax=Anguilla anguilla TaxID=7936 RepID=A0A0E9W1L3_ANGAN